LGHAAIATPGSRIDGIDACAWPRSFTHASRWNLLGVRLPHCSNSQHGCDCGGEVYDGCRPWHRHQSDAVEAPG
jgi:hypothetical protein